MFCARLWVDEKPLAKLRVVNQSRSWIEISRAALRHNLSAIQAFTGTAVRIMPVIKSNAYGHGVGQVLTALRGKSVWGYGVAYGQEALALRSQGYTGRIVVLSNWQPAELNQLVNHHIELAVWDRVSLAAVMTQTNRSRIKPKVHIKLDTGTTRIGFLPSEQPRVSRIWNNNRILVAGIFSHLAKAEEASVKSTVDQTRRFTTLMKTWLPGSDQESVTTHLSCTAAILRCPEARFDLVRLGIGLYGLWPSEAIKSWSAAHLPKLQLHPALSWYTQLVQVKKVPPGTGIGYGASLVAKRPMTIGVIPVGYGDGYDRRLSNQGHVIIRGQAAPVVGRVCMNLTMVDLTTLPSARRGDRVTLLGLGVEADDVARACRTINYDIVCRINWSIPRLIV